MPRLIKAGLFPPVTASAPFSNGLSADTETINIDGDEVASPETCQGSSRKRAASATLVTPPPASQESQEEKLNSNKRQKGSSAVRQINFFIFVTG